jgi:hypothetical protein
MKKSILTLGLASAILLGAGYFSLGQVSAHFGGQNADVVQNNRGFDADRHAKMQEIIERQDYDQWLELTGDRPIAEYITEENFTDFLEMMRLRHEGDFESAEEYRVLLGLPERGTHRLDRSQDREGSFRGRGFGQYKNL